MPSNASPVRGLLEVDSGCGHVSIRTLFTRSMDRIPRDRPRVYELVTRFSKLASRPLTRFCLLGDSGRGTQGNSQAAHTSESSSASSESSVSTHRLQAALSNPLVADFWKN
jgi:hypothetical protein